MYLKRKEIDDVLGGADAWKNVDQTEGQERRGRGRERCPNSIVEDKYSVECSMDGVEFRRID